MTAPRSPLPWDRETQIRDYLDHGWPMSVPSLDPDPLTPESVWAQLEAIPGFNEDMAKAGAELAAGRGIPWKPAPRRSPLRYLALALLLVAVGVYLVTREGK